MNESGIFFNLTQLIRINLINIYFSFDEAIKIYFKLYDMISE